MKELINENSKGPNISLGAVYIMDKSLGRHVNRRTYVDIFEFLSVLIVVYFVNFAKPKSAILA